MTARKTLIAPVIVLGCLMAAPPALARMERPAPRTFGGAVTPVAPSPGSCYLFDVVADRPAGDETATLHASFRNLCREALDLDGRAQLLVDGRIIASAQLGKDDSAQLAGAVVADGPPGFHEVRLQIVGVATTPAKAKPRIRTILTDLVRYVAW